MAGVISTGTSPKALWPGIFSWWGRGYNETEQEWLPLFDTYDSKKHYEEVVQITPFGLAPQKAEGSAVLYTSEVQGPVTRYTHVAYALGYICTREELDDNLYAEVSQSRARALGFSFRQTKENVAANVYNRAFNNAFAGGDGVSLLNTAHPLTLGGTFSNTLAVAADLSEASLEDLTIQIIGTTDDAGNRINLMPRSLIIQQAEIYNAQRILKSTFQSGTANNDINALNHMNVFPEGIKMNRYLTSPHAFFIRTDIGGRGHGMTHFNRVGVEFTQDNDFDTENMKYKGYERYSFGWTDPRALFGSNGP
jgi:hypothetical protein